MKDIQDPQSMDGMPTQVNMINQIKSTFIANQSRIYKERAKIDSY